MNKPSEFPAISRRYFLGQGAGVSLGALALESLMAKVPLDFAPKAKRVIFLFMNGAPSQQDLFDYKPKLDEFHGKELFKKFDEIGRAHV